MSLIKFEGNGKVARRITALLAPEPHAVEEHRGEFIPRVDIVETRSHVFIEAELPGIAKGEVEVVVTEDRILTIQGEKKRRQVADEVLWERDERRYGAFERAFPLPPTIDIDNIEGEFRDGVLFLSLRKRQLPPGGTRIVPIG